MSGLNQIHKYNDHIRNSTSLHTVYPRGDYNSGPSEICTKLEMVDQFGELQPSNNKRNLGTSGLIFQCQFILFSVADHVYLWSDKINVREVMITCVPW